MTVADEDNVAFVCHACIGDRYLKTDIRRNGGAHNCMICGKRKRAMGFADLCERVHEVITGEFDRTANEPESWAPYKEGDVDWERDGEPVDQILYEVLGCDEPLMEALKEELSNNCHSFDDAAAGEEDPYGDEVHYEPREPNDIEFRGLWSIFETEIRTKARFFSSNAKSILDEIFRDLNRFTNYSTTLIREAGPNTSTDVIYRARRASGAEEIARMVKHPATELSSPPSRLTGSGRMNPRWISMFYGAFDPDTCIAEIRPPIGSYAVLGKFSIVRKLKLLDLGALKNLFVKRASYFDPEFRHLRDKAGFMNHLVEIMSRPVMPSDEDYQYLPTQAVAEYLSENMKPRLDGLIFPSSQRDGYGENVVLFPHASTVASDGSDDLDIEVDFGSHAVDDHHPDITLWIRKKSVPRVLDHGGSFGDRNEHTYPLDDRAVWTDLQEDPPTDPSLSVEVNSIEVRIIKAVEYKTEMRRVYRYEADRDDLPF